jgi:hypothetical protein
MDAPDPAAWVERKNCREEAKYYHEWLCMALCSFLCEYTLQVRNFHPSQFRCAANSVFWLSCLWPFQPKAHFLDFFMLKMRYFLLHSRQSLQPWQRSYSPHGAMQEMNCRHSSPDVQLQDHPSQFWTAIWKIWKRSLRIGGLSARFQWSDNSHGGQRDPQGPTSLSHSEAKNNWCNDMLVYLPHDAECVPRASFPLHASPLVYCTHALIFTPHELCSSHAVLKTFLKFSQPTDAQLLLPKSPRTRPGFVDTS